MECVYITLTKKQIETLQPLFDQSKEAIDQGDVGSIFCQAWKNKGGKPSAKPVLQCGFIGHEKAKKISDVIRGIENDV